jgi:hypothetical protein
MVIAMTPMVRNLALLLVIATASPAAAPRPQLSDAAARVPVLVELFTSEGCNSCPPADNLLELLSKEQPIPGVYVVALSEHVTYWDHQGWKDPFGSPKFDQRQAMYTFRFRLTDAFTPQAVVDGVAQMVGSDREKLRAALSEAARRPKSALTVTAASNEANAVTASASGAALEAGATEGAELVWALSEDSLEVDVKRGENARRTLRHSGVVRSLTSKKIESADVAKGMTARIKLKPEWKRENLRLVAFVQSTKSKRVMAIGWASVAQS